MKIDYERVTAELVRALRGKLSQGQLSQKLGYRGNQVYRWENSLQALNWREFVHLCRLRKVDLKASLSEHLLFGGDPAAIEELFPHLISGPISQSEVARATDVTRLTVARWQRGKASPTVTQVFRLLSAQGKPLLEFLETLLGSDRPIPSLAPLVVTRLAEKAVTYDFPYAAAVLRALELKGYRKFAQHEWGWVAKKVGITIAQEREVLRLLGAAGAIEKRAGKFQPTHQRIDTRGNPGGQRKIRSYWIRRGLDRLMSEEKTPSPHEHFGHNVFSVSAEASTLISREYHRFFETVANLVEADLADPTELFVMQVMLFRPVCASPSS